MISLEYAYLYPPGCPMIVPGERISRECIKRLAGYQKLGFKIEGWKRRKHWSLEQWVKYFISWEKVHPERTRSSENSKSAVHSLEWLSLIRQGRSVQEKKTGWNIFFTDEAALAKMEAEHKIIEIRSYDTVHGIWKYFTAADGQIDLESSDYLMIGTLESFEKMCGYFGKGQIVPVYVEVEDGERLFRALSRERMQEKPKYAEMCRRFLADTEDFSEENLSRCGIQRRFQNIVLEDCLNEIMLYIQKCL